MFSNRAFATFFGENRAQTPMRLGIGCALWWHKVTAFRIVRDVTSSLIVLK